VGKTNNDSNHPDSPGLPYRSEGVTNTATVIITLALVFYSIGVWSERFSGRLKVWHLVFFWLGFVCDTWGTGLMLERAGGLTSDVHGITGVIAIVLVVLVRKDERWITNFHKFSVVVWLIWLIPYFSPMFLSTPA
jgi:uncharacterized repeat protein (TIGR03987 family)